MKMRIRELLKSEYGNYLYAHDLKNRIGFDSTKERFYRTLEFNKAQPAAKDAFNAIRFDYGEYQILLLIRFDYGENQIL